MTHVELSDGRTLKIYQRSDGSEYYNDDGERKTVRSNQHRVNLNATPPRPRPQPAVAAALADNYAASDNRVAPQYIDLELVQPALVQDDLYELARRFARRHGVTGGGTIDIEPRFGQHRADRRRHGAASGSKMYYARAGNIMKAEDRLNEILGTSRSNAEEGSGWIYLIVPPMLH